MSTILHIGLERVEPSPFYSGAALSGRGSTFLHTGSHAAVVRLEFAPRKHGSVSVSRDGGGKQRRLMGDEEGAWIFAARAQKRPFTPVGGQSGACMPAFGKGRVSVSS